MTNMHAFDPTSRIRRYTGPGCVLRDFFPVRLEFYRRRREWLEAKFTASARRLANRARFVGEVASGDFQLFGSGSRPRSQADIEALLHERGYDDEATLLALQGDSGQGGDTVTPVSGGFDYLLGMRVVGFTDERSQALHAACNAEQSALKTVQRTLPSQMWQADLEKLRDELASDPTYLHNRNFNPTTGIADDN